MPTQNQNTKFKRRLKNRVVRGLFVLLLLFSIGLTSSAYGEDSVFHYVKPDWWSEGLWPNGLKYAYGMSDARYDLNKEGPPISQLTPEPADDSITGYSDKTTDPRFPWAFTFPESSFGQWGSFLFFGQSFLDYNPPELVINRELKVGDVPGNSFHTEEDRDKCTEFIERTGNCFTSWDIDNKATYMAGYSIGFSPFVSSSGNSRFLKFSIGIGMTYVDINIDLSLCSNAGKVDGVFFCDDKTNIDSTKITGFYPMTTWTIRIYEYIGENFGIAFLSGETARTTNRTEFKNHENLDFTAMITDLDLISISWFF
jgi:hypothetical protein